MRLIRHFFLVTVLLAAWVIPPALGGEPATELENFEQGPLPARWAFSNGPEFPGAKGNFERTAAAAHDGKYGGELKFDFTGGGNYVAVIIAVKLR